MCSTSRMDREASVSHEVRWKWTFVGLLSVVGLTFTANGVALPMLRRRIVDDLGGGSTALGIAVAASAVAALATRPTSGQLAQRLGPRTAIASGLIVAAASGVAYLLPFGVTGVVIARFTTGLAEAMVMTSGAVWTVSLAPASQRGRVVGLFGLSMWGGLAIGPALGEIAYDRTSYGLVWTLTITLPLVGLTILAGLRDHIGYEGEVSRRWLPRSAVLPGLALASGSVGYAVIIGFAALAMTHRGVEGGAMLISVFSGSYVTVRLFAGSLPDRVAPIKLIVAAASLEAAGLMVLAVAPTLSVASAGAAIAGFGFTLLYPALAVVVLATTPPAERGATLGAVSSFLDLGVGITGLVGGVVAARGSYVALFALAALLALTAVAPGIAASRHSTLPSDDDNVSSAALHRSTTVQLDGSSSLHTGRTHP